MAENVITVDNLEKIFKLPHERQGSVKSAVVNFYRRNKSYDLQRALKGISFEVKSGEFLGIVGRNGSGKSTLLKLLAGIYDPTKGSIQINGKLTPFIELGVGFSPELTGRENVFLNGALLGFDRKEMKSMYKNIVDFAELHGFMDQKLKNYSSGMQVRLAFSIATRVVSDILVLDEVLAVGDAAFQRKCFDYFMQLKKQKKTVVLVTHDMGAVRQYCDRAIMIEGGNITSQGTSEEVAQAYQRLFSSEINKANKSTTDANGERWGNRKAVVKEAKVTVNDEKIIINCTFEANEDIPAPILGFSVKGPSGNNVLEGNTERGKLKTKPIKKGAHSTIRWSFPNMLKDGKYSLTAAICDQSKVEFYDWYESVTEFTVIKEGNTGGSMDPNIKVEEYK